MKKKIRIYYTTCGDLSEAREISKKLILQKKAVCVNIIKNVESFFIDKNSYASSNELILIIKTDLNKSNIEKLLESIHSYDTPFVVEIKTGMPNKKYLCWAFDNLL
mgnify:CR=1 FL=1